MTRTITYQSVATTGTPRIRRTPRRPGVRGFTLVELIVSASILAVLMLATSSSILLVARTVPDGRGRASVSLDSARALDMLATELTQATAFSMLTPAHVSFTLPDQNGDGTSEQVAYRWSLVVGQPLTRTFNGVTTKAVDDVSQFALAYDIQSATVNAQTVNRLRSVGVSLRRGGDTSTTQHTAIRILNQPQVN